MYAHGAYLVRHLEWNGGARGNHYLADVAGLLFAAAYLPRTAETDAWLAFAIQELVGETEHQFTPDGACFESSTVYHRLSAEMVVYATALVLGLGAEKRAALAEYDAARLRARPRLRPAPIPLHPLPGGGGSSPFGPAHVERMQRMAELTRDLTKSDDRVHQVGDNDSGRFLKLWPAMRAVPVEGVRRRLASLAGWDGIPDGSEYREEDVLDHRHLVAAIDGLFGRADFAAFAPGHPEREIVRALAGGARFAAAAREGSAAADLFVGTEAAWERARAAMEAPGMRRRAWSIPLPPGAKAPECCAYPWLGVYILRFGGPWLAVRCGGRGQDESGAHAHNDQLAVEVQVQGVHPVRDPGTYLYTPLPERRNEYRSARAHNAPLGGEGEPAPLDRGLFQLGQMVRGECLYFGPRGFAGTYRGWGEPVYRMVEVMEGEIRVTDAGRTLLSAPEPPPFSPATTTQRKPLFSWMAVKASRSSRHMARDMAPSLGGLDSVTTASGPWTSRRIWDIQPPPGRPKAAEAPSGGSAAHEVASVGVIFKALSFPDSSPVHVPWRCAPGLSRFSCAGGLHTPPSRCCLCQHRIHTHVLSAGFCSMADQGAA